MAAPSVFVTGGTRGIGRAIALRFAREGARVVVAARTSDDLDSVVAEIEAAGGRGDACQANLRDPGSLEAAVFRAVDFFDGSMDVLVNNVGTFELTPFPDTDAGAWERMMETNLTGPYLVTMEALGALGESDRAHVFNICSRLAKEPCEGSAIYTATKAGLAGLTAGMRLDLAPQGIRVTAVFPRATDTRALDPYRERYADVPLNAPEDVAEVVWDAWRAEEAPAEVAVEPPR